MLKSLFTLWYLVGSRRSFVAFDERSGIDNGYFLSILVENVSKKLFFLNIVRNTRR